MTSLTTPTPQFHGTDRANQLNPGPAPRPRRKLGCKSILLTLLVLLVCWAGYALLRGVYAGIRDPHARLYQDMNGPYRPREVVRPLMDANQTFDVVATVWLRTEGTDGDVAGAVSVNQEKGLELREMAIFSDTVFRGLRLADKKKRTAVELQIPIEIFKARDLNNYDLRASFVLVPTSPSLLDNATGYSTWRPALSAMYYPPVRSWPHRYNPSIAEEIIDSYGTFMPLIAFHNIQSACPNSTTSPLDTFDDDDEEDRVGDEESEEQEVGVPLHISQQRTRWTSTKGKHALAAHPYIITRSFLRVVDMTKIYNKKAYDDFHNRIKATSCGRYLTQQGTRTGPSWKDCVRSFVSTGNQEVRIKLAGTSETTGKERTEWAYVPYLELSRASWGPMDLVPIPAIREVCRESSETPDSKANVNTVMNVTWHIAFAGRSPSKFISGGVFNDKYPKYNMTDTEANNLRNQAGVEIIQSFSGHHTRDEYHPRRGFVLYMIVIIVHFIDKLLEIHYWYTRSSTVGISTIGTGFVAGAVLGNTLLTAAWNTFKRPVALKSGLVKLVYWFITSIHSWIGALLMLRAITRAEIHWRKRWIPVIRFAPPTHAERTSRRVDARVTFRFKAIAFAAQATFLYFVDYQQYFIINPRGQYNLSGIEPRMGIATHPELPHEDIRRGYAAAAYIKMAEGVLLVIVRSPWIVGERRIGPPLEYQNLFELVWCTVLAAQAYRYSSVASVDEEEETK